VEFDGRGHHGFLNRRAFYELGGERENFKKTVGGKAARVKNRLVTQHGIRMGKMNRATQKKRKKGR